MFVFFFQGVFPGGQGATIGVDFMIKTLLINGRSAQTRLYDSVVESHFKKLN